MSSISSDWEHLTAAAVEGAQAYLEAKGLGSYAKQILEAADVESVEDLKLVDHAMAEEIIQSVGLKMVSAKKLRLVLEELQGPAAAVPTVGGGSAAAAAPPPSGGSSDPASGHVAPEVENLAAAEDNSSAPVPAPAPKVDELIVVCVDRSSSMGSPFREVTLEVIAKVINERTRMEAVKAMFYAFRDRVESLGLGKTEMGLLQFDDKAELLLPLTPQLDRFEAILDNMAKRGATAIYSSIVQAATLLKPRFEEDKSLDLRVVVLTDGQNNSGVSPETALHAVQDIGVVVDAIIVGESPDANLRKIVTASGGECWQIKDLGQGFELLESESVVSLKARRSGAPKPVFQPRSRVSLGSVEEKAFTPLTEVTVTSQLAREMDTKTVLKPGSVPDAASSSGRSSTVIKRLMTELKKAAEGAKDENSTSCEGIHIFPTEDVALWRALIEGPKDSPFEGGIFLLNIEAPTDYPFRPPKIMFATPIYHCNVSDAGKVCLDILLEKWNPALTILKCLEVIRIMMAEPNPDDALRQWIAELTLAHQASNGTDTRYADNAKAATAKDASKSLQEWKIEWGLQ